MPLNIKDEATHELARKLAARTGQSMAKAVREAIEEKLAKVQNVENQAAREAEFQELMRIARYSASLPVKDDRPADEILGYDEFGLPN